MKKLFLLSFVCGVFGADVALKDALTLPTQTPTDTNAYVFSIVPLTATTSTPYKLNLSKTNLSILSGFSLIATEDIDSQAKFEDAVGWTLPAGGGGNISINGTTITNANFTNSATALITVDASTNINVNPTNIANAQIASGAAIDFSKLNGVAPATSGTSVLKGNGSGGFDNASAPTDFAGTPANPTAMIGLSVVNGSASSAMRSDGAPALDQGIAPTWTAPHNFNPSTTNTIAVTKSGITAHTISDLGDSTNLVLHTYFRDSYKARPTNDHTITLSGSLTSTNQEITYVMSITVATNATLTTWSGWPTNTLLNGTVGATNSTNQLGINKYFVYYSDGLWEIVQNTAQIPASLIAGLPVSFGVAASDETTDLTTGTNKVTFRAPFAFTLTAVRASVITAPVGSTIIVDINENDTSVLSTKLSIDTSAKTSTTASSQAVISDTAIADDSEIEIDIDQVGSSTAGKGLKVWLIGVRQ